MYVPSIDEPEYADAFSDEGAFCASESPEQAEVVKFLEASLEELARRRWSRVYIGRNSYFAWLRDRPATRVAPDLYLVDDPPAPPIRGIFRTWLPGRRPPRWAFEVVTSNWRKDYEVSPRKYEALGCRELVVFDPRAAEGTATADVRVPLTVWRRDAEDRFVRVHAGAGAFHSPELGVWLVPGSWNYYAVLLLAEDASGKHPIPPIAESEAQARKRETQARRREAQARRREAQARERAEGELDRLRRQLAESNAVKAEERGTSESRDPVANPEDGENGRRE
jgi:hypothetical protein